MCSLQSGQTCDFEIIQCVLISHLVALEESINCWLIELILFWIIGGFLIYH